MESQPSFEQLIKEDRATRDAKKWRGTLLEYLELVRSEPLLTRLAHSRVYEMIIRAGAHDILETDEPRVKRLYKDESV
jgi:serine protein kinase